MRKPKKHVKPAFSHLVVMPDGTITEPTKEQERILKNMMKKGLR